MCGRYVSPGDAAIEREFSAPVVDEQNQIITWHGDVHDAFDRRPILFDRPVPKTGEFYLT